jgi:hypothetical protein
MCLVSNKRFPRIAQKDIKVKKLLLRNEKTGEMCTPFRLFPVSRGLEILQPEEKITFLQILCGKYRGVPVFNYGYKYAYREGFIHSYGLDTTSIEPESGEFFLEAIIPKGTLYFFNSEDGEYCSTKLKLIWPEDKKQIEN